MRRRCTANLCCDCYDARRDRGVVHTRGQARPREPGDSLVSLRSGKVWVSTNAQLCSSEGGRWVELHDGIDSYLRPT